jgi:hypothetical protein
MCKWNFTNCFGGRDQFDSSDTSGTMMTTNGKIDHTTPITAEIVGEM